jgi:hypothetical protein
MGAMHCAADITRSGRGWEMVDELHCPADITHTMEGGREVEDELHCAADSTRPMDVMGNGRRVVLLS